MKMNEKPLAGVQAINRAFNILESFTGGENTLRLTDISRQLRLHKSTTHRLLSVLKNRGYVCQDLDTGNYRLGLKILRLSDSLSETLGLTKIARPVLEKLAQQCRETVHLLILDNDHAVYIGKVEYPNTIHLQSRIGKNVPLHCAAAGKVLLANLEQKEIAEIIGNNKLVQYTKNTITSISALNRELEKVRRQGYGLDNVEYEEGVRCISVPIWNYSGRVVAAMSISGPTIRIKANRISALVKLARKAGAEISRHLGYEK